jgi:ABC-type multidrug transport system fused ATPase/permease subunit
LTIGELVSFLGYGLFMVGPIRTFFEFAQKLTRALVSAQKAVAVLELTPPWTEPASPPALPRLGDLVDGERLRGAAGTADGRGELRARVLRRAGGPARPLVHRRGGAAAAGGVERPPLGAVPGPNAGTVAH